jgi:hypothetical protein
MEHLFDTKINILKTVLIPLLLFGVGCSIIINPIMSAIIFSSFFVMTYIFFKPRLGLILCIATAPVLILEILYDSPIRQISDYYPLSVIIIAVTFCAWALRRTVRLENGSQAGKTKYFLPILFISYVTISLLWTIDLSHGICMTFRILIGICLFFLLNDMIVDRKELQKIITYLPFLGLILASLTLLSKFKIIDSVLKLFGDIYLQILFWSHNGIRPSGFANSALAANALVFFIFMTIAAYSMAVNKFRKALLIAIGLFCLSMMLLISSKAAVGSLLAGIFFIIYNHPVLRKKVITFSIIVIIVLVSVYTFNAVFIKGGERLTGSSEVATTSLSSRLDFWKTGFSFFKNRWIGAGAGGILKIIDPVPNSHSTYFSILFDFGVVGLSIFIMFLVHAILSLRRAIKNCSDNIFLWMLFCIGGSYIALLVHSLVDNFHYDSYFWLVLGLVYTITTIASSNVSSASSS